MRNPGIVKCELRPAISDTDPCSAIQGVRKVMFCLWDVGPAGGKESWECEMRKVVCGQKSWECEMRKVICRRKSWECGIRIAERGLRHGSLPCGLQRAACDRPPVSHGMSLCGEILGMWNEDLGRRAAAPDPWGGSHGTCSRSAVGDSGLGNCFFPKRK